MTVLEVIQRSSDFLARKGVDSPRLQIELLLAHVLQLPRLKLYLNFERVLTPPELERLRDLVKRRAQREPLQHILGSVSFCGFDLAVNRDVLVPRPETELLAERAWQSIAAAPASPPARVLDFGTGSGCLAICLAAKCPAAQVHAIDISEAALAVARQNAQKHGLADRIQFYQGEGFAALPEGFQFDWLVGNPPYIPTAEIATLQVEVRDFDPHEALDGGEDGLSFYRRIAREAPPLAASGARALLEFGDGQEQAVSGILADAGWHIEGVEPDYSGRKRILIARRTKK